MDKKSRDNRANQMNPNNPAYYKSRQGSTSKPQVKVVHHVSSHSGGNQGFACRLCGKKGKLSSTGRSVGSEVLMRCGYCNGTFWKKV